MQMFNGINAILFPDFEDNRGIVYKISCKSCDSVYVDQIPRALKTRVKEHAKAIATLDKFFVGQTPCAPQP